MVDNIYIYPMKAGLVGLMVIGCLSICCLVRGQGIATVEEAANDSLVSKYLTDTLDAARKIEELMLGANKAKSLPTSSMGEIIERYQIALTLAPYVKDSFDILSKLYAGFGTELHEASGFDMAVQYIKTSLYYCRLNNPQPSSRAYNLLGKIGGFYLQQQLYDSAQYYYSLTLIEAKQLAKPVWLASANNNNGILQYQLGKYAEAGAYFEAALNALEIKTRTDSTLKGSIVDNQALLAFDQKNYAQALALYQSNLLLYKDLNNAADLLKTHIGLAKVYLAQHNYKLALQHLQKMSAYLVSPNPQILLGMQMRYHGLYQQYYQAQNDWKAASAEQQHLLQLQDSMSVLNSNQLNKLLQALTYSEVYKFRKDIQLRQMQLAEQGRDLKSARAVADRNRLIALVVALAALLIFVFYRNKGRLQKGQIELHKKEQQLAEANLKNQLLEQDKLQRELDYKQKDISDLALYLSKLKDLYDTMLERLEDIRNKRPDEQKQAIASMTNELGMLIHSQEKINMVQENLEVVNKQFSHKLMEQYPDLTKSEIELCGFFRLNMSNKEIGLLKNISPQSVKMARYRLRKKFGLAPESDIYKFLSGF